MKSRGMGFAVGENVTVWQRGHVSCNLPTNVPVPVTLTPAELRVWVVHYSPFVERRAHLEGELEASGFGKYEPVWLLEHDREVLPPERVKNLIGGSLNVGHVSVILKHLEAVQAAAASEEPFHLILEDDVRIHRAWEARLAGILAALPEDWEILFIGDGCNLHVPWWRRILTGKRLREAGVFFRGWRAAWWGGGGMSRCAAGYVIRPESARRFLKSSHIHPPFEVAIDWMMNRVGEELKFRSYWAEPPLVTQGAFESWTKGVVRK